MTNLIRSAKSGSNWSTNKLMAYNISVHRTNFTRFFGHEPGPIDHLDPNLLSSADPMITVDFSQATYRFLAYLDLASHVNASQESAIDDFGRSVLEVTGFDIRGTILHTRYVCGDPPDKATKTDVCLVHLNSMILLVVQEDKMNQSGRKPEAQVIAKAIATFQYNNGDVQRHR
jgi:hypothetical protein